MTEGVVGLDPDAVARWLTTLGIEFQAPLQFQRIGLGQSNLTYRVSDAAGRSWVLRRPPLGHLLASAHDVLREARIIAALADTPVPVTQILSTTTDSEFCDVPLVLMEFVEGLVVDTMSVAEALTPRQRQQIAVDLPRTLAKIHAVTSRRSDSPTWPATSHMRSVSSNAGPGSGSSRRPANCPNSTTSPAGWPPPRPSSGKSVWCTVIFTCAT